MNIDGLPLLLYVVIVPLLSALTLATAITALLIYAHPVLVALIMAGVFLVAHDVIVVTDRMRRNRRDVL